MNTREDIQSVKSVRMKISDIGKSSGFGLNDLMEINSRIDMLIPLSPIKIPYLDLDKYRYKPCYGCGASEWKQNKCRYCGNDKY
jgi:hypothetical protein